MRSRFPALLAALLLLAAPALADRVVLVDGTVLEGDLLELAPDAVRILSSGAELPIPREIVRLVEGEPDPAPPADGDPPDRLTLRDGGLVVGRIFEESADSVRVRIGTRSIEVLRPKIVTIVRGRPRALSPEGRALARAAIGRLDDGDPAVRASASAALRALGAGVEPLVAATRIRKELLGDPEAGLARLTGALGLTKEQAGRTREILARAAEAPPEEDPVPVVAAFRERMAGILTDVQARKLAALLGGE